MTTKSQPTGAVDTPAVQRIAAGDATSFQRWIRPLSHRAADDCRRTGRLDKLSWWSRGFISLSSTIAVPLYGKWRSVRPQIVLQVAIGLFLVGLRSAGLAQNMTQLVLMRGHLQGSAAAA